MTLEEMKRIKSLRGYSLAQLSEISGVPLGTLQKIWNGETKHPRFATLQALERVLAEPVGMRPDSYGTGKSDRLLSHETPADYKYTNEKSQGEYTVSDYYALPGEKRMELIDGIFYDQASPLLVHQDIAGVVYHQMIDYFMRHKGSCKPFIAPIDVELGADHRTMVQPDVFIVCDPSKLRKWGIYGAPDFILEILSPATRRKDMSVKLSKYIASGVREYWMLDIENRRLIIYELDEQADVRILPLQGQAGISIYDGALKIDLDQISALIDQAPGDV